MKKNICSQSLKLTKPAFGTEEWAKFNFNIQKGCQNDCRYCFAKNMAIRFGRSNPESWVKPVLNKSGLEKYFRKMPGRIMFPTTHDITQDNVCVCQFVLENMLRAGNEILIVTKPNPAAIRQLFCTLKPYADRILFRFTIGSSNDSILSYWEPGASSFKERLLALESTIERGFRTSVACEPMLDTNPHAVIAAARPFVTDSIWLGKAFHLKQRIAINCPNDFAAKEQAEILLQSQPDCWIHELYSQFKDDPIIKWKSTIKNIVGLERPVEKGLDI